MDGRVARGERNRRKLVDAALALTAENQTFPTAPVIAERAGLTPRSVFHHFSDLDELFASAAATQATRHWQLLGPTTEGLDLADRITEAVAQRSVLFERIRAVRRVAVLYEHDWPALARAIQESRAALRRHIRNALRKDLTDAGRSCVAAIEAAASWETWEVLRQHQGLSVAAAKEAVTTLISAVIRERSPAWAATSCS